MRASDRVAGIVLMLASFGACAGAYEDMIQAIKLDDDRGVTALLAKGVDVDSTVPPDGDTLLMLAAKSGKPEMIKTILSARPRVNARNVHGESALMQAAFRGHVDAVKQLLAYGAEVNQDGWTALIYAAAQNRLEVARLLIARGARVDAQSGSGVSALMMAAREGHLAMVLLLMEHGADLNLRNQDGLSALRLAQDRGQGAVVEMLARAGAKE